MLLVDDDPGEAERYALALTLLGACVTTAAAVDEALAAFAHEPFDIVVSDIALPDRSGYDLARELRAAGVAVPAIAVTGWSGEHGRIEALAVGFDEYCPKPCRPSEIAALIARLVGRASEAGG